MLLGSRVIGLSVFQWLRSAPFSMEPSSANGPGSASSGTGDVVRDNYIPLFDGKPANYKEWRKRISLYQMKMKLGKKQQEGIINLLTSLTGVVWKQVEHPAEVAPNAEDGFEQILSELEKIYKYDEKVEMPRAFEKFFYGTSRGSGQTLMAYCADHREAARDLLKYGVGGRVAADGGYRPRNQAYRPRPAAVPGRWTRQWKSASANAYTVEEDDYPDETYNEQEEEDSIARTSLAPMSALPATGLIFWRTRVRKCTRF